MIILLQYPAGRASINPYNVPPFTSFTNGPPSSDSHLEKQANCVDEHCEISLRISFTFLVAFKSFYMRKYFADMRMNTYPFTWYGPAQSVFDKILLCDVEHCFGDAISTSPDNKCNDSSNCITDMKFNQYELLIINKRYWVLLATERCVIKKLTWLIGFDWFDWHLKIFNAFF